MESEESIKGPKDFKLDEIRQLFIRVFGVSLSLEDNELNVPEVLTAILELDLSCVHNPESLANLTSGIVMDLLLYLLNQPHPGSSVARGIDSTSSSPSGDYNLAFIRRY